jgi:hypothetical protein
MIVLACVVLRLFLLLYVLLRMLAVGNGAAKLLCRIIDIRVDVRVDDDGL